MREEGLQENSIIYLSTGFEGPFILQAFSVRKLPAPSPGLHMCLTDGKVYIGAKYNGSDYPEIEDYWLLEVTAKFLGQNQPIIIKTLRVHSTYPRKLLGSPPCTLTDYFIKETNRASEDKLGQPTKKVKYSNAFDAPLLKNSDSKKPAQKQRTSGQFGTISPNMYKKRQEIKTKQEADKRIIVNQKKLKIADSEQQYSQQIMLKKQANGESSKKQQKEQQIQSVQQDDNNSPSIKNSLITDLYERRPGWTILCRINNLNKVDCQNGLIANNFMLADQNGNEIKCVYFQNPLDGQSQKLQINKYYSFSGGEISKGTNKTDGSKQLQINFDKNSTIIPRSNIQFGINLSRFCRISTISSKQANSEVNVVGIVKCIKFVDQSKKNKLKYNLTLCDPLSYYQVDLPLFLNNNEKPADKGTIGFLHNYQLFKQGNICRLNSTYKSYFRQQKSFKDPLTLELKKAKQGKDWQTIHYKNLSSVPFSYRTIKDLKKIIYSTDDEKIFSLIDCWVLDMTKKKYYHACKNCKKGTDKKDSGVYYCQNCRRNVQTFHCHTINVNFADFTSHLNVDVIGEHAQTLLELKSVQFNQLSSEKQISHLDSLRLKNITLKLKTERRQNKRQSHSVWAIQSSSAINTLKQIRKKLQQKRIKFDQKW